MQPLHSTGVAVLLGILAGFVTDEALNQSINFDEDFFFYFVLPPIIFASGYNMKRRRFFKNISYIGLFGIFGTIVHFVISVVCVIAVSNNHWIRDNNDKLVNLKGQEVLLLCAVLSASDTVAAISIMPEAEAPDVHSVMMGEGVMNDAVAIILFNSAMHLEVYSIGAGDIGTFIGEFLMDMFASIAIGILFGVISAVMTKYLEELQFHPPYETALLFFIAYIGYLITTILGFSGVISILCIGIVMGHYTWYNLSVEGRIVSRAAFEIMGELLDAFVFVYIGFGTYTYVGQRVSYGFIGLMIAIGLFSRFVSTVILPTCLKLVWRQFKLKFKELVLIWIGGSIRGAIAFALILSVTIKSNKELLKTTVLGIVLFTTIVFGSLLPLIKQVFPLLRNSHSGHSQLLATESIPLSLEMLSTNNDPSHSQGEPRTKIHRKWRQVDNTYLKRWLLKNPVSSGSVAVEMDVRMEAGTQTKAEDRGDSMLLIS